MKKFLTIACGAIALALVFLSSGCATDVKCRVAFTRPPSVIKAEDLAKLNTLKIQMSSNFSSNVPSLVGGQDASFATGVIQEKVVAALYKEGYYRVTDVIWGDVEGVDKAYKNAKVADSAHGYPSFVTESFPQAALLKINFNANVTATQKTENKTYKLKRIPYEVKTDDKGVPSSKPRPDQMTIREETAARDFVDIQGNGELAFELIDADGNSVYQVTKKVSINRTVDDGRGNAYPTNAAIVEAMTTKAIQEFVEEISPHKDPQEISPNKDGNKEAILLLGAGAYSEAIEYLEKLPADKLKPADYENLGIAFEAIGDLNYAKDSYEKAGYAKGLERVMGKKADKKTLKKADKTNDDTSFKADK